MIIGTCGKCGGCVKTPDIWHGVNQPTPKCENCHSVPAQPFGATIPMKDNAKESRDAEAWDKYRETMYLASKK